MTTEPVGLGSTRTVDRAVQLLAAVCDQGRQSLTDCARRTGIAPSTALRLLRTLSQAGLIQRDEHGVYSAGPRLVQLGVSAMSRETLISLAGPALHRLVAACGESAYLSLPAHDGTAFYAAMVDGLHSIRHTSWAGRSIPLDGSAAGLVLRGHTPATGYVVMRSAVESDVTAIAAPIYRPGVSRSAPVAAVSVIGPTYRMADDRAADIGRQVADAADTLSRLITTSGPGSTEVLIG